MFTKPGKYIARAKEFLGRQYGRAKLMASRVDDYATQALDLYKRTSPVLEAISDVGGGAYKGHLQLMNTKIYSGAKEYERLRSQIASNSARAEEAATKIGSTVESAFFWLLLKMGEGLAKAISQPITSCTHDCSRYCLDECDSQCQMGCCNCRVQTTHHESDSEKEIT